MMVIEKDQEILLNYRNSEEFVYGSREFRRQFLVQMRGFFCACSECSREGQDLQENDLMRAEIWEKNREIIQLEQELMKPQSERSLRRRALKKTMKLVQQRVTLIQKLNLRTAIVGAMIDFYKYARMAEIVEIPCANDPNIYKQEALKYAKMFGDNDLHCYNDG